VSAIQSTARSVTNAQRDAVALLAVVGIYAVGFVLFPPRLTLISDEAQYIRQAVAFAHGQTTVPLRDAKTWTVHREVPSFYPQGTSLLQTPFVAVGGWRAAPWVSVLGLAVMVFLTALVLRRCGCSPIYAALIVLYLPAAVLGRSGMSDVPSGAVVVLGWWSFIQGPRPIRNWALAGFLAGASILFRDTNPLFFVPLFIGAVVRREPWPILVVSGLAGLALRPLIGHALGQAVALHVYYPFSVAGLAGRLALYAAALMVFVPGGLLAVARYRGRYWPEVMATVGLAVLFFGFYSYSGQYSGFVRNLVLGPRYLIPLVPMVAVAIGWAIGVMKLKDRGRRILERAVFGAALLVAAAVHPIISVWTQQQAVLVDALYRLTSPEAVLVTEFGATAKYLNELYGERSLIGRDQLRPEELARLRVDRAVQLVFLDRNDSDYWLATARDNATYTTEVSSLCELEPVVDIRAKNEDRLRIWNVRECRR
jgi:hypothetical protein